METTMNTEPEVMKAAPAIAKGVTKKNSPNTVAAASKKPAAKATPPKPTVEAKAPPKKSSAVADICRELKIAPPQGRAKLRRAGLRAPYVDMTKVRAILTSKGE
jgi:hypothetical protein